MIVDGIDYSKVRKVEWSKIDGRFGQYTANLQTVEVENLEDAVNKCRQILEQHFKEIEGKNSGTKSIHLGGTYSVHL